MTAAKHTPSTLVPLRRALLAATSAAAIAVGARIVDLSPVVMPSLSGK